MALYVVTQPDPPPGADFELVAPGNRLYDVTGITATLSTAGVVGATMFDSSGNARHGTYTHHGIYPTSVAGIVSGDAAIRTRDPATVGLAAGGNMPALGFDRMADFSIECWLTLTTLADQTGFICRWNAFGPARQVWLALSDGGSMQFVRQDSFTTQLYHWDLSLVVTDGLPHHYVCSFGPTDPILYVDNVVQVPDVTTPHIAYAAMDTPGSCFEDNPPLAGVNGTADELSVWGVALTAGQVAAHYAAGLAGIGPYTAAILADGPAAYYHLNEGASTGRQPSLIVTNGTTELEAIPSGFPAVATPGPYQYAWQPLLRADTQSSDGTLTTVAIPELVLPAGYTVGTRTLDIQPADQWSNVTLWWDDVFQQQTIGLKEIVYPPGAYLVIVPQGA